MGFRQWRLPRSARGVRREKEESDDYRDISVESPGGGLSPAQVLAIILAAIIGGSLGFYLFATRGDILLFHNGQLVDEKNADAVLAALADKGNHYTVYTMRGTGWGTAFILVAMIMPAWFVADLIAWSNRRRSRGRV